jgi:hypothetical protein
MAFDQTTRNRLARFVGDARTLLAEEFARQLQNDFGLDPSTGDVAELASLARLDDSRRETARLLRDTMEHYLAAGSSEGAKARQEVLTRIVREQAFTVLNRLCAIRMAEARGLLIDSVANGYQSKGFQLYSRLAGTALGETGDAYRCYLFSLFDELAMDLPVLFDRFSAQGRLFPRESALLALLDLINHPEIEPLWPEDESIGWVYQYFNTQEERRQMRADSPAPRNSRELAVRNQFFTPRYVVEFLVDNTLGRIWYEMAQGRTSLADTCRYLVRRSNEIFLAAGESPPPEAEAATEELSQQELLQQPVYVPHRPLKDPRDIRMLDPACGSMHFGLYAFDLFERIYDEAWDLEGSGGQFVRSEDFAPLRKTYGDKQAFLREVPRLIIERNIHGIDIDPRAVQIAGLSLWLRAQRSWKEQGIKATERPQIQRSNIVCAEPMPGDEGLLDEFLHSLREDRLESLIRRVLDIPADKKVRATPQMSESLCGLVRTVWKEMELAGEAGSLLKIDEALTDAVTAGREEWEEKSPLFRVTEFGLDEDSPRTRYLKFIPGAMDDFWTRAEALVLAALESYAEQALNGGGFQRRLFAADAARGFAFIDVCQKRYDVVLMNPPFGRRSEPSRHYFDANYGSFKSDMGLAFVELYSHRLVRGGQLGAITSRTFLAGGSFDEWRRDVLLSQRPLRVLMDLGIGVLDDALVETCAYVVQHQPAHNAWFLRALEATDKNASVEAFFTKQGNPQGLLEFYTPLEAMRALPTSVMAYWLPPGVSRTIKETGTLETIDAATKHGVQTTDDFQFMRLAWEVPLGSVSRNVRWPVLAKGGEYAPYFDNLHLCIDWLCEGSRLKAYLAAKRLATQGSPDWTPWMNSHEDYFRPGLTFPARTASDFCPRVLPSGCVFTASGQALLFPDLSQALGYLGGAFSRAFKIIVDAFVCSGDNSVSGSAANTYRTGLVNFLPLPTDVNFHATQEMGRKCVELSQNLSARDETSLNYCPGGGRIVSLSDFAERTAREELEIALTILELSDEMDRKSQAFFGFSDDLLNELHGPLPTAYAKSCKQIDAQLLTASEEALVRQAIARHGPRRQLTKKAYAANRRLELLSHIVEVHPSVILNEMERAKAWTALKPDRADEELSLYVGCALGRWDIRFATGEANTPSLPNPFTELPPIAPGILRAKPSGQSDSEPDHSYPLEIPTNGVLVDEAGHAFDIEASVRRTIEVIWGKHADTVEREVCELLGTRTVRDYLAKPTGFFANHLSRYSKSRRQAPIYWPLSTRAGSYTLWLYYHRLNDQTLYSCVNDFIDPKVTQVSEAVNQLRRKNGRSSEEEETLERLTDLERELAEYRDELLRVAKFWKPNLNDGVQITASPLWKLFQHRPWQSKLREVWEALERGEYDWAHLAMSIWPARVVPKCVTDRSLAIAHDLEDLFWVDDDGRWRNPLEPDQEVEEQKRRRKTPLRDRARGLIEKLADTKGDMSANAVISHLSNGDWDDQPLALLLWPERVLEECWHNPVLADKHKINFPNRRTQAAKSRLLKELVAAACPDLADQLTQAFDSDEPLSRVWHELAVGNSDHQPLAMSLWPDRVIDKCTSDADLAEGHAVAKYFWVRHPTPAWRRRVAVKTEIANEIARRQGKPAAETN